MWSLLSAKTFWIFSLLHQVKIGLNSKIYLYAKMLMCWNDENKNVLVC